MLNGMDKVNDRLWVGGDPRYCDRLAQDVAFLNQNVDLVIDCRSHGERYDGWNELTDLEVPVIHVPMFDDFSRKNSPEDFIDAWAKVNALIEAEELPVNPTLYVHCHMGVNRGPSMAMFFMIMEHEMSAKEAFLALREARFGVGIAYAGVAVQAALFLMDNQERDDLELWNGWENNYWAENGNGKDVQTRIKINHGDLSGPNVVVDDRGIVHVTQASKEEVQ